jgi:hypothetical protein
MSVELNIIASSRIFGDSFKTVAFGSMGYEAHISKNKSKFVIAL